MGLFNKTPKKLSLDEILTAIDNLSEDEKAEVKAKVEDLYKAEDEREIDKIEEDKADDTEVKDEKSDEVAEESEEIAKDVDTVEEEVETDEEPKTAEETTDEPTEETEEAIEEPTEEPIEEEVEEFTEEPEFEEPTAEEDFPEEEPVEEETPVDEPSEALKGELYDSLMARFTALEEAHAQLSQKYDELYSLLDAREKNQNFGSAPEVPETEDETRSNKSVYSAYAGANAHKYY